MTSNSACKESEARLQMMKQKIREGAEITSAMKAELVHEWEFCNIMRMSDFWENYNVEVKGAVYPTTENSDAVEMSETSHSHQKSLTEHEMQTWVDDMWHTVNGVKDMGEHWTVDETTAVLRQNGEGFEHLTPMEGWVAMNMIWHDYSKSAIAAGMLNEPKFYAALSKDFLHDEDGKSPSERLYCYYHYMR